MTRAHECRPPAVIFRSKKMTNLPLTRAGSPAWMHLTSYDIRRLFNWLRRLCMLPIYTSTFKQPFKILAAGEWRIWPYANRKTRSRDSWKSEGPGACAVKQHVRLWNDATNQFKFIRILPAIYRWPLELCWNVSRHRRHQVTWPADGGSEGFGLLWRISRNDVWCFTCNRTITCQYVTDSLQQNLHSLTKMRRNDQTKHLMCPRLHIQCWWTKWMHYYYIYYMFTLSRAQAVQDRSAWRP